MMLQILPTPLAGRLAAIASKSQAHRLLICAALGDRPAQVICPDTSQDMEATVRGLCALGAQIDRNETGWTVRPIAAPPAHAEPDVGESGSTLRFLLPLAGALGVSAHFRLHGRLPQRPLAPFDAVLTAHGMTIRRDAAGDIFTGGRLCAGDFALPGNVSSQFFSGLAFALPLLGGSSTMRWTTPLESAPYLTLTRRALAEFGIHMADCENGLFVHGGQHGTSPAAPVCVEGDWSNAAFPLCAGALAGDGVTVTGLRPDSPQGDRKILDYLRAFGAQVTESEAGVTVRPGALHGLEIDAADVPDLVPVLAAVAAAAQGETRMVHAARLRIKESDRLCTTRALLRAVGAEVTETADGLCIHGGQALHGARVDAAGDHRIAMTAAVLSVKCGGPVTVCGAEAVAKSYPGFWADFAALGGRAEPWSDENGPQPAPDGNRAAKREGEADA